MSARNQVCPLLGILVPIFFNLLDDALDKSMVQLCSSGHVLLLSSSSTGVGTTRVKFIRHVEASKELAILLSKRLRRVQTIAFYTDDFERFGLFASVRFTCHLLSPTSKVVLCLLLNRVAFSIEALNRVVKHLNAYL